MLTDFERALMARKEQGTFRELKTLAPLVDFSSNDFLGLARCPKLCIEVMQACHRMGSTGSRLLTGNSIYAETLEKEIAAFHGFEAGLLFNCGYMANLGLLSSVAGPEDSIFFDARIHASTLDGMRLSRATAFPFRHNDSFHLEERLKNRIKKGKRFICIESLYSTDGSKAPLIEICNLAKRYEAHLIVDEAHAVGVYGPEGRGLVAEIRAQETLFADVVTFGKALGVQGAIVLGSKVLKEHLINFARPFIYTTALPFFHLAMIRASYELLSGLAKERQELQNLCQLFCSLRSGSSSTHIQPIYIPGSREVRKLSYLLAESGFDVRALVSPTVRRGEEQLRICLHAFNTENEIRSLLRHVIALEGLKT